jgi:hypothetical protein
VGERLAPLPDLVAGRREIGDLAVAWAAGARAPVEVAVDGETAAVLWGEAIAGDGRRVRAIDVLGAWGVREPWSQPPYDGYHAAVRWDPQRGVTAAADPLGLFPVYHWTREDVVVIASSPDPIRRHPRFTSELDVHGLAGMLLVASSLDGRTLQRGVTRLGPGAMLRARSGCPICADRTPPPPMPSVTRASRRAGSRSSMASARSRAGARVPTRRSAGDDGHGVRVRRDGRRLAHGVGMGSGTADRHLRGVLQAGERVGRLARADRSPAAAPGWSRACR